MTRRSQGSKTVSTSRAHPLRSSGAPVLRRGRLLVLLSLLALALGLWARAPLRELWLARQPLGALAAGPAPGTAGRRGARGGGVPPRGRAGSGTCRRAP